MIDIDRSNKVTNSEWLLCDRQASKPTVLAEF